MLGAAVSAALIVSACQQSPTAPAPVVNATAVPGQALALKMGKVDVCHLDDDGAFRLINVNGNASPAHLAHGDGQPGVGSFDEACGLVVYMASVGGGHGNEASGQLVNLSCPAGSDISVTLGSYGHNCVGDFPGDNDPDKTAHLALTCNGGPNCAYFVDHTVIGDPFFGCYKEYRAEWNCVP